MLFMYQERRSRHGVKKRGLSIESLLYDHRVGFFWLIFILSRIISYSLHWIMINPLNHSISEHLNICILDLFLKKKSL